MTAAENIKYIFSRAVGRFYIPSDLLQSTEKKILHISDTPTLLYPAVKDLVRTLKPDVVIHTGDLADDIKLELFPHNIEAYERAVKVFIRMIKEETAGGMYIVPGNHDSVEIISKYIDKSRLVKEGEIITVGSCRVGLAHSSDKLPEGAQFNLYGHNFNAPVESEDKTVYLNGIRNIHVIFLPSYRVGKISYPWATNYHRKINNIYKLPNLI